MQLTLFACLIPLLISSWALPVAATDAEPALDEARAVYLYHIEGETTVIAQNADQSIAAGSAVKILSGLLFCEALAGRESEFVTITPEMVATSGGRSLGIRSGDVIPVGQLLYAALCGSYNDAYHGSVQRPDRSLPSSNGDGVPVRRRFHQYDNTDIRSSYRGSWRGKGPVSEVA